MYNVSNNEGKQISYLNKTFTQYKNSLIEYAQTYFPNTYTNFEAASPAMMFIDMSAYVGDVLSFYIDYQYRENLLSQAQEAGNVYRIAQVLGYKPRLATAATTELSLYQQVPAIGSGTSTRPDYRYALTVGAGLRVQSTEGAEFYTKEPVNFASSGSSDTTVSVYEVDETGQPTYYLLQKNVICYSGKLKTAQYPVSGISRNHTITLPDGENIIEVLSCRDSQGKLWYEVDYMAQDTIFLEQKNEAYFHSNLADSNADVPYLLTLKRVPRRFITRINEELRYQLQFGSGVSDAADEEILPNPDNIGSSLPGQNSGLDRSFDPTNFMYTRTYGLAPANITLTIEYMCGEGITDNVSAETITTVISSDLTRNEYDIDDAVFETARQSFAVNNLNAATGAKSAESIEEVRYNALASYASQNRVVTKEDYIIRTLSMPGRFGSVSKAYVVKDEQVSSSTGETVSNPLALNIYTLSYDSDKFLVPTSETTKQNLKQYLSQYRMMTDAVNIKNGFIINIGINFTITTTPGYNANAVLVAAIDSLKRLMAIDNMQFNQPIIEKTIFLELAKVDGVQNVMDVDVFNLFKTENGYSGNVYPIPAATRDGIIYPSTDPSIFEVKFPDQDIRGQVVSY
tara:strand:+ start:26 stop:1906 length:1881 start_codon:yes stop_codon:yes gene_type:complete